MLAYSMNQHIGQHNLKPMKVWIIESTKPIDNNANGSPASWSIVNPINNYKVYYTLYYDI